MFLFVLEIPKIPAEESVQTKEASSFSTSTEEEEEENDETDSVEDDITKTQSWFKVGINYFFYLVLVCK